MKRCINMGNSLENSKTSEWGGGWGGGGNIAPSDFANIKNKGFDTVRIPVRWNEYTGAGPDYTIEPEFVSKVKGIVDSALEQDLNVILNVHHFREIMKTPETETPKLAALWEQIGDIFKDYPDDLWFETLNEPSENLKGELMRQAQRVSVKAIRNKNPDRLIILGGDFWSGYRELKSNIAPPDANIIYTFHYYEPFDFTHYLAEWTKPNMPKTLRNWGNKSDKADLKTAIQSIVNYRDSVNRPVFLGEFGVYTTIKNKDRAKWITSVRAEMESADIPWCLWAYANTFPAYNPDTQKWDQSVVKALGLK